MCIFSDITLLLYWLYFIK